ncbi:MAG: amidohydrolase family protein [Parahaliea sp.]
MKNKGIGVIAALALQLASIHAQSQEVTPQARGPIIDVHVHSADIVKHFLPAGPPHHFCHDPFEFTDPGAQPMKRDQPSLDDIISCGGQEMKSPETNEAFREEILAEMKKYDIVLGINSDTDLARMKEWEQASDFELWPAALVWKGGWSAEETRALAQQGKVKVIGEIAVQYNGLGADDPMLQDYYALAEEQDLPVGIHIAAGAPGNDYIGYAGSDPFNSAATRPLDVERILRKYPKLRIYVMHAGWPALDEMLLLMYMHPQVYVDISMINWTIPRKEFHRYLETLMGAGMGKRIMFGTDYGSWPAAVGESIEAIDTAEFLTAEQKRDIFYNNAVRFLRLDPKTLKPLAKRQ